MRPGLPKDTPRTRKPAAGHKPRRPAPRRGRWVRAFVLASSIVVLAGAAATVYTYITFSRLVAARLHGERERTLPRVFARPVELRRGQSLTQQELVGRLNDLGYAIKARVENRGEFAIGRNVVLLMPRGGRLGGKTVRVTFPAPRRRGTTLVQGTGVQVLEVNGTRTDAVQLDAPLLTALMTSGAREKRRHVPLTAIPKHLQQAVLAIEDQGFYSHPGINPVRLVAAAIRNVIRRGGPPVGYSTITQQLSRMFFFEDEFNAELRSRQRSPWRKVREGLMSLVLERRASKDEILELYLNDVYLGQRGSFAIHGVAEASRIFFGKDVANVTIAEGALIAGVIQNPSYRSPFVNPKPSVERRNVVLHAMAGEGYLTPDQEVRASREPLQVMARAVDNEAPYFVDMIGQQIAGTFPGLTAQPGAVDVYTTLDLNLQRAALDAMRHGLTRVDDLLAARRRRRQQPAPQAQAVLIAVDPRSGDILAMIGGRSYNQSQYNRAVAARRQPGSVFKPFVFLAAFERAADEGRNDLTPASITLDEPGTFEFDGQVWEPKNYDDYDGAITWRRALAMSRNLGTIRVAEQTGFDRVAALWRRVGVGTPPRAYPSITLGVFELTPLEVAQAYTLFTNGGSVRPLRALDHIEAGERDLEPAKAKLKSVARADTTYLVTNMMRSVINEGTGAGARAAGFTLDAAGKSGTTNDLRDAWFVGFTPDLLTVVWVGRDDNQPLSLSGTQAALPIWTEFMKTALAGRGDRAFEVPEGIATAAIDPDSGRLATPDCPRTLTESFLAGTEPTEMCELHGNAAETPR